MILQREQITRYLRHIIMPEISGPGQKKLLESSVTIYGENVNIIKPAVFYLAASGIGTIFCNIEDTEGFEKLSFEIHDLNSDVSIDISCGKTQDYRFFLGRPDYIYRKRNIIFSDFVPTIISIYNGWKGGIEVFKNENSLGAFISTLSRGYLPSRANPKEGNIDWDVFSACFLGTLGVLEIIKLSIGIGETADDFLYSDLLSMEFSRAGMEDPRYLIDKIYDVEQMDYKDVQLKDKKVLIVGTGGLGSPAAIALALSGVGTIGLVDYDAVEISNLNRQILHSKSRLGMPKVESAKVFLKNMNPSININTYNTSLDKGNVFGILKDYDAVIDAVDNFPTRFLLNDACYFSGKPMMESGVLRFDGSCMTIIPGKGPCYRCVLADIPSPGSVPSCSESGIAGPIPGIFGFLQSVEAVKLLSGQGKILNGRIVFFDGLFSDFNVIKMRRRSKCNLCGEAPTIHGLQEYNFVCNGVDNKDIIE